MAQHFLLSKAARELSLKTVFAMSDDQARTMFAEMRWGDPHQQTCPHCGVIASHRYVRLQKRWKCRECYQAFSVTSGTAFQHHKLSLQTILAGLLLFANAVKGVSAPHLSRDLHIQYKSAFVLLHKIWETLWKTQDTSKFEGDVEIDAAHVHTCVRPKNKKVDRIDRRLEARRNKLRCIVLVIRQRYPPQDRGMTLIYAGKCCQVPWWRAITLRHPSGGCEATRSCGWKWRTPYVMSPYLRTIAR